MTNIRKPTAAVLTDRGALQELLQSYYAALGELQAAAAAVVPESVAAAAGTTEVVVIRGATVTLPGQTATFTADVYVTGIKV